jgi:hypothetical protein
MRADRHTWRSRWSLFAILRMRLKIWNRNVGIVNLLVLTKASCRGHSGSNNPKIFHMEFGTHELTLRYTYLRVNSFSHCQYSVSTLYSGTPDPVSWYFLAELSDGPILCFVYRTWCGKDRVFVSIRSELRYRCTSDSLLAFRSKIYPAKNVRDDIWYFYIRYS